MDKNKIDEFSRWWLQRKKKGIKIRGLGMSEATLKAYQHILKYVPNIEINSNNFEQVRVNLIDYLRKWEDNTGIKFYPQVLSCIRSYLKFLEETNVSLAPQIKYVRLNLNLGDISVFQSSAYTQKYFIQKALTKEEIRDIINFSRKLKQIPLNDYKIDTEHLADLIQVAYDTGCRINELVSIKEKDISLKDRAIVITGKGMYIRTVNWEASTHPIVEKLITKHHRITLWSKSTAQHYLKALIRLWAEEKIKNMPSRLRKENEERLNKISWHWFRHSRATHLAIVWKDVLKLTNYMGWSRIEMANIYLENSQKLLKMLHYKHTDLWLD